jgi:hypothetical protein
VNAQLLFLPVSFCKMTTLQADPLYGTDLHKGDRLFSAIVHTVLPILSGTKCAGDVMSSLPFVIDL